MKFPSLFSPDHFVPSSICSVADEGAGDGGAGGGGDGGDPGVDDKTRDLILRTVNAAVSNQLGRKLPTAIEQGVGAAFAPIQESIQSMLGNQSGKGNQSNGQSNGQGGGEHPELVEMKRKQKALEAQLADERKAREDQERKGRASARDNAIQQALGAAGVEPLRMRGAMAEVLANVQVSEDGQVFYRDQSKGYDEDLALSDGMKRWASTDVGKSYLAPKPVQGSGASAPGRGGGPRPGAAPTDPAQAKAQRIADAKAKLPGLVAEMIGSGAGINLGSGGSSE